eukprot:scaffold919_cov130-Cylindrotheca_fusiformis.AAC.8
MLVEGQSRVSKSKLRRILWLIIAILVATKLYVARLQWIHHQSHPSIVGSSGKNHKIAGFHESHPVTSSLRTKHKHVELQNNHYVHNNNDSTFRKNSSDQPKWAYAFLIAACDPDMPLTYRNYIYNILVAANLLDSDPTNPSKGDVILMIQFTTKTNATRLPDSDLAWLQNTTLPNNSNRKIRIHYLPLVIRDNFYLAQLEKFRILELTEYSRILYLDADVMPLCNLDYLFELSENGKLRPNVVLAGFTEPSQGGFFLLETKDGYYQELLEIVERREQLTEWNDTLGWGAVMDEAWHGIPSGQTKQNGTLSARTSTRWGFHGGFADQGLLYYWTRFHRQNVSIIFLDRIEHWENGNLQESLSPPPQWLLGRTCLPKRMDGRRHYGSVVVPTFLNHVPHRDFIHFTGSRKPWEKKVYEFPKTMNGVKSSHDYWYYNLGLISENYKKENPTTLDQPTLPLRWARPKLGRFPTLRSMVRTIDKKKELALRRQQQQQQQPEKEG